VTRPTERHRQRSQATRALALSGWRKRLLVMSYDAAAMGVALWLSFVIRLGEFAWPGNRAQFALWSGAIACGLVALAATGVYRVMIRFLDIRSASRLAIGAWSATTVWFILAFLSRIEGLPRSVGVIYFGVLFMLMFFGRVAASYILIGAPFGGIGLASALRDKKTPVGIAVFGANAAACALVESMRHQAGFRIRFFVDDDPAVQGRTMMGYPVRPSSELRQAVEAGVVEQVLLAMPSTTRAERLSAISSLSALAVPVLTMPTYEEIMSGRYTVSEVRPVRVEDLLKRDIVPAHNDLIERGVSNRSILITGAGGSIGSEICRQIFRYGPERMILLDHSEFALYSIEAELARSRMVASHLQLPEVHSIIGSLLNEKLLKEIIARYNIDTVFHAAAYKHVPLLEHNEVVGVENNVMGTKVLADACAAAKVRRFTMISTDKAVRPTNVMGSSKRMAELYIQALAQDPKTETRFGIVRFGNVLDSSGSVVQQFRRQLESGGPITVTHPEITRFFMSIPEATQLVLQANSLAREGEVFVLDMGEPVLIADLARTMISLSGMTERTPAQPSGDIEISYVGLRPGEKLHEELFIGDSIEDTLHPQIKMARERSLPLEEMNQYISQLRQALDRQDPHHVREILKSLLHLDHALAA
jgi:FlaA1/EpsC-like NDP-sugar epimerase